MANKSKTPQNDERSVVIDGQVQLVEAEGFSVASPKLKIKDRYWLILSRLTYNNSLKKHTIIADTMKQAVQDFLIHYGDNEEFLMINEIEFGALNIVASTL